MIISLMLRIVLYYVHTSALIWVGLACLEKASSSHIQASTIWLNLLLYKAEKPSVCPSALFWRSVSRPWLHGSTSDLLDVIAMSSGMTKFILKVSNSLSFSTRVPVRYPCRSRQPLTTAIQCTVGKALDFDTLGQWSGI